jgi:type II secretory pathway pseudopilin PulG
MKKIKINQKGFTWQELVIALAISGVIALTAGLLLHNSRQDTRDLKRLSDIKTIQHALELYYYDCNVYPTSIKAGSPISGIEECQGNVYLQWVPIDPNGIAYGYVPCIDETVRECSGDIMNPGAYQLHYKLESNVEGITKGSHVAVPGKFVAQ